MGEIERSMIRILLLTLGHLTLLSSLAVAQRTDNPIFSVGVGVDHATSGWSQDSRPGMPLPYLSVEVATGVLIDRVDVRLRAGSDISPYGAWAGLGPSLELDLFNTPVFLEASVMPGLWVDFDHEYRKGLFEQGLGYPVEFRSQIGLGWHLNQVSSILLSISHKSNANIPGSVSNPGIESVQIRYNQSF